MYNCDWLSKSMPKNKSHCEEKIPIKLFHNLQK